MRCNTFPFCLLVILFQSFSFGACATRDVTEEPLRAISLLSRFKAQVTYAQAAPFATSPASRVIGLTIWSKEVQQRHGVPESLQGDVLRDEDVKLIATLIDLESLWIAGDHISADSISALSGLRKLRHLSIEVKGMRARGIAAIGKLHDLQSLTLDGSHITDADIETICKALKNLTVLSISRTQVTNAAIRHIKSLPKLRELHLSSTKVDDNCLSDIADIPQIQHVTAVDTNISDAAALDFVRNTRATITN